MRAAGSAACFAGHSEYVRTKAPPADELDDGCGRMKPRADALASSRDKQRAAASFTPAGASFGHSSR